MAEAPPVLTAAPVLILHDFDNESLERAVELSRLLAGLDVPSQTMAEAGGEGGFDLEAHDAVVVVASELILFGKSEMAETVERLSKLRRDVGVVWLPKELEAIGEWDLLERWRFEIAPSAEVAAELAAVRYRERVAGSGGATDFERELVEPDAMAEQSVPAVRSEKANPLSSTVSEGIEAESSLDPVEPERFGTGEESEVAERRTSEDGEATRWVASGVGLVSDAPRLRSDDDELKRVPLARAVVKRLRAMDKAAPGVSFHVHLDGPWGAGKTTLLHFIASELGDPPEGAESEVSTGARSEGSGRDAEAEPPWVVVEFNAWRASRIGPPWWALLRALRSRLDRKRPWHRRQWLRVKEGWRRLRAGGAAYFAGFAVVLLATAVIIWLGAKSLDDVTGEVDRLVAAVGSFGALWAVVLGGGRFLFWDSERGARLFERSNADPQAAIAEHFGWLIDQADGPVVFQVDDLDRCGASYVVDLLESTQTLVRSFRKRCGCHGPHFVVAADGEWIQTSYEYSYETFAERIREPGRPLGHLFLDKIFQLSVRVPELGRRQQDLFMRGLLRGSDVGVGEEVVEEVARMRAMTRLKGNTAELRAAFADASEVAREQAAGFVVERLADEELQDQTRRELERFAGLLDPNPRSMTRFVNAFSMAESVLMLEGAAPELEPLALWTVIEMRWPTMARHFRARPTDVDRVTSAGGAVLPESEDKELAGVFGSKELAEVVHFGERKLTSRTLRAVAGTR